MKTGEGTEEKEEQIVEPEQKVEPEITKKQKISQNNSDCSEHEEKPNIGKEKEVAAMSPLLSWFLNKKSKHEEYEDPDEKIVKF